MWVALVGLGCSEAPAGGGGLGGADGSGGASTGGTTGTGGASGGTVSGGNTGGGSMSGGASTGGATTTGGASTGGTTSADVPNTPACAAVADWPEERAAAEEALLVLVNEARAAGATCGGMARPATTPLTMDPYLRCAARLHSLDMGEREYFSHATWNAAASTCEDDDGCPDGTMCAGETSSSTPMRCGKTPSTRVSEVGGPSGAGWENIAAGNDTVEETMDQWMNSAGHCNNIMNSSLKTIGIGWAAVPGSPYTNYWTQAFDN